jgi:hypothetical protein
MNDIDNPPPSPLGTFWRWLGWAALAVFVGSLLWSVWFETLLPLMRAGDWRRLLLNLIGIPLLFAGTGLIVYGGFVFLRDMLRLSASEAFQQRVDLVQSGTEDRAALRAARRENLRTLWVTWKPGFSWIGLGFLLIAAGGFIINR